MQKSKAYDPSRDMPMRRATPLILDLGYKLQHNKKSVAPSVGEQAPDTAYQEVFLLTSKRGWGWVDGGMSGGWWAWGGGGLSIVFERPLTGM